MTSSVSSGARCSISVTLPTLTPAIRTGDAGLMFPADGKTACTVCGFDHGTLFVNAYSDAIASSTIRIRPIAQFGSRSLRAPVLMAASMGRGCRG